MTTCRCLLALTLLSAALLAPAPAHATCMFRCKGALVYGDCSLPPKGKYPANRKVHFTATCETCCSPPGGPLSCSPTSIGPVDLKLVASGSTTAVPGNIVMLRGKCNNEQLFNFDQLLKPGKYEILAKHNQIIIQFEVVASVGELVTEQVADGGPAEPATEGGPADDNDEPGPSEAPQEGGAGDPAADGGSVDQPVDGGADDRAADLDGPDHAPDTAPPDPGDGGSSPDQAETGGQPDRQTPEPAQEVIDKDAGSGGSDQDSTGGCDCRGSDAGTTGGLGSLLALLLFGALRSRKPR